MRIQHNIMAMSAYRNYTNNVSAMKSNLEKLSSGYKINRAGDDAAGLAISEKMRAQITGLETAQKNAKDGISLVQTAEGALTEVHDMLNRMVELASMSANGTYDNDTDRAQLQKEMDQLTSEINRIADSSNFNGIKLLNGDMDAASVAGATYKDMASKDIIGMLLPEGADQTAVILGTETQLESDNAGASVPQFTVRLDGLKYTIDDNNKSLELKVNGQDIMKNGAAVDFTGKTGTLTATDIAKAYDGATVTIDGLEYTATAKGTDLVFDPTDPELAGGVKNEHWDVTWKTDAAPDAVTVTGTVTADNGGKPGSDATTAGAVSNAPTAAPAVKAGVTPGDGVKSIYEIDFTGMTFDTPGELTVSVAGQSVKVQTTDKTTMDSFLKDVAAGLKDKLGDGTTDSFYEATVDGNKLVLTAGTAGNGAANTALTGATSVTGTTSTATKNEVSIDLSGLTFAGDGTAAVTFGDKTYEVAVTDGMAASDFADALIAEIEKDGISDAKAGDYTITNTNGTIKFEAANAAAPETALALTMTVAPKPAAEGVGANGSINVSTNNVVMSSGGETGRLANTVLDLAGKFTDGTKIKLGDTTYTVAVGKDSAFKNAENVVDLTDFEAGSVDENVAASRLTVAAKDNGTFSVGHREGTAQIGLQQLSSVKESTDMTTMDKLASYLGISTAEGDTSTLKAGKGLTLQIGDTADDYNKLTVNIRDMHAASLGIEGLSIADQDSAAAAIDKIKDAINMVSDVRGTLGATQNRLDHTINNLSVMTENIQDAESTIRDVDVAEEMMAYTKNNILIQASQAMLAQANQVPQGVLQLLQ